MTAVAEERPVDGVGIPDLLFDGEEGVAATEIAGSTLAVTTHRLLVHAPEEGTADGTRFHAVHRPNVLAIRTNAAGGGRYIGLSLRLGLYAVVLLGAGVLIDFDGLIGSVARPDAPGLGGVVGVITSILQLLTLVDDVLLAIGAVVGVGALGFAALAVRDRARYLEVAVAGGDPIRVPVRRGNDVDGAIARLESALETG